jgi:hypothetical protein
MGMMSQAIEDRVGRNRIWEEGNPVGRRPVTGEDDGALEMPFRDDLIEVLSLGRG